MTLGAGISEAHIEINSDTSVQIVLSNGIYIWFDINEGIGIWDANTSTNYKCKFDE